MKVTDFETASYIMSACGLIGFALIILHGKRPENVSLDVAIGFLMPFILWNCYILCAGTVEFVRWVWTLTPWGGS